MSTLDYLPAPDASGDAFASFAAAYQAAEPGTYRAASFQRQRSDSGITTAKLRLRQEDHWQEYVYELSPGKATPREMYLGFGPAQALGDIGRFLAAVGAAVGFLVFVGFGWVVGMLKGRAVKRQRRASERVLEVTES